MTFTGTMIAAQNHFFHVTIDIMEEEPWFEVMAKPAASKVGDMVLARLVTHVEMRLSRSVGPHGYVGSSRLPPEKFNELTLVVREAAQW